VAHFPKPFYKKSRACWYVEIDRKQIKLGPDQAEAFRLYHELMAAPRVQLQQPLTSASAVAIIDLYLDWVHKHRAPDTYEWYRYLDDEALAITKRLMLKYPVGPLFRNSRGDTWTPDAVNCVFDRIQLRQGRELLDKAGRTPTEEEIKTFLKTLKPTKTVRGVERAKRPAELRCEAKQKLWQQFAKKLSPRCSLYALRHSWATNALKRGVDPLTAALLMGHKDPSMLARVYQHLSHSPEHMRQKAVEATRSA